MSAAAQRREPLIVHNFFIAARKYIFRKDMDVLTCEVCQNEDLINRHLPYPADQERYTVSDCDLCHRPVPLCSNCVKYVRRCGGRGEPVPEKHADVVANLSTYPSQCRVCAASSAIELYSLCDNCIRYVPTHATSRCSTCQLLTCRSCTTTAGYGAGTCPICGF